MSEALPPQSRIITPGWLPQFNKRTHNHLQKLWSPYLPPWAVLVHTGRKSGTTFETPVTALRSKDAAGERISVILMYGSRTDWMRNLFAAGQAEMRRGGHRYRVRNPRVVTDPADPALHPLARQAAKKVGVLVADIERIPSA